MTPLLCCGCQLGHEHVFFQLAGNQFLNLNVRADLNSSDVTKHFPLIAATKTDDTILLQKHLV